VLVKRTEMFDEEVKSLYQMIDGYILSIESNLYSDMFDSIVTIRIVSFNNRFYLLSFELVINETEIP
jgi:hypothetical protein